MMDAPRRWRLLDPGALSCKALLTAVMGMVGVVVEEEGLVVELLEVMVVAGLAAVEVEAVDQEEEVVGEEEPTALATTVVKEATLLEIVLMSRQVIPGRAVVEVARATATTVESLDILQGIAPQQPVHRE
jgi:hypothetical protein